MHNCIVLCASAAQIMQGCASSLANRSYTLGAISKRLFLQELTEMLSHLIQARVLIFHLRKPTE